MYSVLRMIVAMVLAVAPLVSIPAFADDAKFLAEIDDLPLPPGFVELPGGTLFDAPQGRIVEATVQGRMLEVEARSFYDETLPELGWTRTGSDEYRRDKEVLHLEITTNGMQIDIHFSLAPIKTASAPPAADDKGEKP